MAMSNAQPSNQGPWFAGRFVPRGSAVYPRRSSSAVDANIYICMADLSTDRVWPASRSRHAGQLFCAVHTPTGGAVVNAAAAPIAGAAEPAVVIATTGATKQFVDAACARAGGTVSPPADPLAAPQVAVVTPAT